MPSTKADRLAKYDLRQEDYAELAEANDGLCWICDQPESVPNRSLAVDHDHATGAVRGLLCTRCNQTLGRMNDDPALLRKAADYLDRAMRRYSDYCRKCCDAKVNVIATPAAVMSTDGTSTCFAYQCDLGHIWTCWWRTRGWSWF